MPQQQHTLPALDEQLQVVINQGWEHEVLPQLPADYEQQAQRLGAFVRQRQIKRVADRGYSRRGQWADALMCGADVVVRLAVQQVPLLDEPGQSLDVVAWLKEAAVGTQSRPVAFEHEGQRLSGRLIACALSPEAAERARAKARKKASKQQRELKAETLFLAGWLLVFSSLPTARWSDAQVLSLYRARWQVELVIKRDARKCSSWLNCAARRR